MSIAVPSATRRARPRARPARGRAPRVGRRLDRDEGTAHHPSDAELRFSTCSGDRGQPRLGPRHPAARRGRLGGRHRRQGRDAAGAVRPARGRVERALMMPAGDGLTAGGRAAAAGARLAHAGARAARAAPRPAPRRHQRAVAAICDAGARAIVVLGGDGTHRIVARKLRRAADLRALDRHQQRVPQWRETTVAGLATGYYATGAAGPTRWSARPRSTSSATAPAISRSSTWRSAPSASSAPGRCGARTSCASSW